MLPKDSLERSLEQQKPFMGTPECFLGPHSQGRVRPLAFLAESPQEDETPEQRYRSGDLQCKSLWVCLNPEVDLGLGRLFSGP